MRNAIKTPDGTVLESKHRHDYRVHIDVTNGEEYMVDGGLEYIRRSVNSEPAEDLSVDTSFPFEVLRTVPIWGTYGIEGTDPLKWVSAAEMDTDHINKVLLLNVSPGVRYILKKEIDYRNEKTSTNS